MTATQDAKAVLELASVTGIDAVYTENLPSEEKTNTDRTVVLITDSDLTPAEYGNGDFFAVDREVELQIWYALDVQVDPEAVEIALIKSLRAAHWMMVANRQRVPDPDTFQLSKTMYFSQTKQLGG